MGHPGEDIEDVEVPYGLPSAPCPAVVGVWYRSRSTVTQGQEVAEAKKSWAKR